MCVLRARAQAYGFACIILVSEEDSTPILETRVSTDDIYQRQGETIISWTEPANNCDVALSFADAAGCAELWEQIVALQRAEAQAGAGGFGLADRDSVGGGGGGHLGALISLGHDRGGALLGGHQACGLSHELGGGGDMHVELPLPELRNLKALAETLGEVTFYQRPAVVQLLLRQDYVAQLARLFQTVEDLESLPELHALFHIFRTLMMLNDTAIFEQLLRDDTVMAVIGALEYDPELFAHATRHREFLTSVVEFKEVLPISEPAILAKIHQNFRVQYIKDVVLPRSLDDNTFATLNSLMFLNNVAILAHVQADGEYLRALFAQLHDATQPLARRRELSRLLLELCQLARNLQLFNRASFYRRLLDHGLFAPVAQLLLSADAALQLNAAEMLGATCLHDPSMLRQFILVERPARHTIGALMHVLTRGAEAGVQAQLAEVLRALLDPETMEGLEQEEFLNYFYEHFVAGALEPLESAGAPTEEGEGGDGRLTTHTDEQMAATTAFGGIDVTARSGGGGVAAEASAGEAVGTGGGSEAGLATAGAGAAAASISARADDGDDGSGGGGKAAEQDDDGDGDGRASHHAPSSPVAVGTPADGSSPAGAPRSAPVAGGLRASSSGPHALPHDEALAEHDDEALHASRSLVVELLCFCVLHHGGWPQRASAAFAPGCALAPPLHSPPVVAHARSPSLPPSLALSPAQATASSTSC
jgi:protein phosphatase-4 regulatory subunit 3